MATGSAEVTASGSVMVMAADFSKVTSTDSVRVENYRLTKSAS
jgi:hypothetical protein